MDWLLKRKSIIEERLARRHLEEGSLADVTSTYVEGEALELAEYGYSRDKKKGKKQIVFGLLTGKDGCPVAVEVFAGNTTDPNTLAPQIAKIQQQFGLRRIVLVGDRGLLTEARLRKEVKTARTGYPPSGRAASAKRKTCNCPCSTNKASPRSHRRLPGGADRPVPQPATGQEVGV